MFSSVIVHHLIREPSPYYIMVFRLISSKGSINQFFASYKMTNALIHKKKKIGHQRLPIKKILWYKGRL